MLNSNVNVEIIQKIENDTSITHHTSTAKFTKKGDHFYLFYDEINKESDTVIKCRFEIHHDKLRFRRNGEIIVEQLHIKNESTKGYIKTAYGHFESTIFTRHFIFNELSSVQFNLTFNYDLYLKEEYVGNFLVNLDISVKE